MRDRIDGARRLRAALYHGIERRTRAGRKEQSAGRYGRGIMRRGAGLRWSWPREERVGVVRSSGEDLEQTEIDIAMMSRG